MMTCKSVRFESFALDLERLRLDGPSGPMDLRRKSFEVLRYLVEHTGRVVTKEELIKAVWPHVTIGDESLTQCVSEVRRALGEQSHRIIKTVPRRGYLFNVPISQSDATAAQGPNDARLSVEALSPALLRRASIAILPFTNLSSDPEQDYFADGIVDDIITALTRMRWLFIIARNSSFAYKGRAVDVKQVSRELGIRYVLVGGVRKSANRIRITALLIDATTGAHIWAERYDRDLTDIFAVQDEITECVAGAIEPELLRIEGRAAISRTENLNAWDTVRQGMWHFHQVRCENALRARELFREAIKLDPKLPEAHVWLGRVSGSLLAYGWSSDRAADLQEGTEAALKAVQLDERDPYAHYTLAITSVFAGALEHASRAAETAIALSPCFALGHLALGFARLLAGNAVEAVGAFEHGVRLSPFDPQSFVWLGNLALAQYFSGNREAALQTALRSFSIRPDWVPALVMLAICCAALERLDEARAFVEQMRQLEKVPDVWSQMKARRPEWAAEMTSMLRKAGLPE
jgi:TolB-like protein/cytochrome c-type biogenesis protein CcmH/NrfG